MSYPDPVDLYVDPDTPDGGEPSEPDYAIVPVDSSHPPGDER